jgi:hypothetical protein
MHSETVYDLAFYALFLLSQFREKRAFPKVLRLFKMDEESIDCIFGSESLIELGASILCSVYDGRLELLKELIEAPGLYRYTGSQALKAYCYLLRDGQISRQETLEYLRELSQKLLKTGDVPMLTALSSCVIDEHFFELIPDVREMYDRNLIDKSYHGLYDGFLNSIFMYHAWKDKEKIHIDDVVGELERWAKYKPDPEPKREKAPPPKQAQRSSAAPARAKPKIGRNDPCPCGSGKKYKKCCLPKGITFDNETEDEEDDKNGKENIFSLSSLRKFYDDSKPYDLMTGYPSLEAPEKGRAFTEFYSQKAIALDIPVYKALYHRAIPRWVQRDKEQEDLERIDLLLEAFTLFTHTCRDEGIETLAAFDEKYMVHYRAEHWLFCLKDLLKEYADVLPGEKRAFLRDVNRTLRGMSNAQFTV